MKCDQDKNGTVEINEFTEEYINTKNQLEDKARTLNEDLVNLDRGIAQMKQELERQKRQPGFNSRGPIGTLTITIKEAQNLPVGPGQKFRVLAQQANMNHNTSPQAGPRAVFNESVTFTIEDERFPLYVAVERNDEFIFNREIHFTGPDSICGLPQQPAQYPLQMTCYNTDERLEEYGFDIRVLI